jgi:TorA maturation chaperone TorD
MSDKPNAQSLAFVPPSVAQDLGPSDEDLARADLYGLMSELFLAPASDDLFNRLAASPAPQEEDTNDLERAWRSLLQAAQSRNPQEVVAEYNELFVAVGKPLVALHASVFITGAMNQRPLVAIREDLARLGLEASPEGGDTEDHIAALCEVMRYLIASPEALGSTLPEQQQFFASHLQPWVGQLCDAIRAQPKSHFYAAVADLAQAFFTVEQQGFDIYAASLDAMERS